MACIVKTELVRLSKKKYNKKKRCEDRQGQRKWEEWGTEKRRKDDEERRKSDGEELR